MPSLREGGQGPNWPGEASRTAASSSYLPPRVGDSGTSAAFGGERLGPAGPASVAPGPSWSLDLRVCPAAGSGASKKLQRRWPEAAPRSGHTRTVAASRLQRSEGPSLKVGQPGARGRAWTTGTPGPLCWQLCNSVGAVDCPCQSPCLQALPCPPYLPEFQRLLSLEELKTQRRGFSTVMHNLRPCEQLCGCSLSFKVNFKSTTKGTHTLSCTTDHTGSLWGPPAYSPLPTLATCCPILWPPPHVALYI